MVAIFCISFLIVKDSVSANYRQRFSLASIADSGIFG